MWHFAQGTHLQMKHLGESPEFSWGSSSIDSSQVRGWFAKHSPVPFNGSKILLAEPQVRDARSTMGCNTSVAWWGSKFLLTRGKKKKAPQTLRSKLFEHTLMQTNLYVILSYLSK